MTCAGRRLQNCLALSLNVENRSPKFFEDSPSHAGASTPAWFFLPVSPFSEPSFYPALALSCTLCTAAPVSVITKMGEAFSASRSERLLLVAVMERRTNNRNGNATEKAAPQVSPLTPQSIFCSPKSFPSLKLLKFCATHDGCARPDGLYLCCNNSHIKVSKLL